LNIFVGSIHQGRELWVIVFKSASVNNGADYIGDCAVHWFCQIKSFSCNKGNRGGEINITRIDTLSLVMLLVAIRPSPLYFLNTSMSCSHSSMILSSLAFLPIPKSLRLVKAKRRISFHESPLDHKTPVREKGVSGKYVNTLVHCGQKGCKSVLEKVLSTMSFVVVIYDFKCESFPELISTINQRLLHRLVSSQDDHFFGSHVDGEHRSICLGKLRTAAA